MSDRGRPKALDDEKQKTVCSLLAAGASLRQAAHFVDCDPKSVRREAGRNDDFRRQLAKAKSEANIEPLETLRHAAKNDWRAALHWMERLDPDRFARPNATVVTQREANQFVADLVESIEEAVSNAGERDALFKLLSAAMPAAMRRRWDGRYVRRNIEREKRMYERRMWQEDQRKRLENEKLEALRLKIFREVARYLPDELRARCSLNWDLLKPEELFAQQSDPANGPSSDDAPNNASLATNNASPPRRNSANIVSSPPANPKPPNDLPIPGEAILPD